LRIAAHRVHNPLDVTYHSMSPYRLGSDTVVRYIVRPRKPAEMAPANFLHDRMAQRLAPVVFDFLVQVRAGRPLTTWRTRTRSGSATTIARSLSE
jgi:hypothetical protein